MANDIAKSTKDLRISMKLTQGQFAELVDLSEDSIGKIERGVSIPGTETLRKIANGANIPLSELLGEKKLEIKSKSKAIDDLTRYLRSKSADDVKLIHEVAVKILERKKVKK